VVLKNGVKKSSAAYQMMVSIEITDFPLKSIYISVFKCAEQQAFSQTKRGFDKTRIFFDILSYFSC